MGDMQAQMGELRKLLDNQAEQIKMLKGSALDPSDVAELKEAARLAEVQQDLDEELRQADSRSFGGYSRSAESAQHGRAVKRYKQQLVQRSDRKEKYLKISSAREFFLEGKQIMLFHIFARADQKKVPRPDLPISGSKISP